MKETKTPHSLAELSPQEIGACFSKASLGEIPSLILEVGKKEDPKWQAKTAAAIEGLENRPSLEAAGKALSLAQMLELLAHSLKAGSKHLWKLSPLLVGMPHPLFKEILTNLPEKFLQAFKDEGVTEPVQHQLTILSHTIAEEIVVLGQKIERFSEEIRILPIEEAKLNDLSHNRPLDLNFDTANESSSPSGNGKADCGITQWTLQIDFYAESFQKLEELTKKGLAIAWNTHRQDLVEAFNQAKESCHRYLVHGIGKQRSDTSPSTGLYEKLDKRLFSIFGDPSDFNQLDALHDSEPAIEALAKLSIWYLRDYWEIGLLPKIKNLEQIELPVKSEAERVKHREQLFSDVVNNLAHIGLHTVKDLKNHLIFSKATLRDYIKKRLS